MTRFVHYPCCQEKIDVSINSELLSALKDMFAMLDEGLLIRDITNDARDDFYTRTLELVERLSRAYNIMLHAERK